MSLLSTTFGVAVAVAVAVISCSASFYNCESGVYETLFQITEDCRESVPHLRNLRKSQSQVSGKDVVQTLQEYCRMLSDVTICVESHIRILPCLRDEMETFRSMNQRSNWYCEESDVKEIFKDMYYNISMESLNYRENECYREAPVRAYPCMRRYLDVNQNRDRKETMKRILSSVRCTFRKLQRKCGRDSALLLTTLEYDWVIIPPALGINVSDTLITIANIKFKR